MTPIQAAWDGPGLPGKRVRIQHKCRILTPPLTTCLTLHQNVYLLPSHHASQHLHRLSLADANLSCWGWIQHGEAITTPYTNSPDFQVGTNVHLQHVCVHTNMCVGASCNIWCKFTSLSAGLDCTLIILCFSTMPSMELKKP